MEKINNKNINKKRCILCVNFKTFILSNENKDKHPHAYTTTTAKYLKYDGSVRVCRCTRGMLNDKIYIYSERLEKLRKACKLFDIIGEECYDNILELLSIYLKAKKAIRCAGMHQHKHPRNNER